MKLTEKYKVSMWAYDQCKNGNDTKEMRSLISSNFWIFSYCAHVRNIREMAEKLNVKGWRKYYRYLLEKGWEG